MPRGTAGRFAAAIVVLGAILLVAVWASGVVRPRVQLSLDSWQVVSPGRAVLVARNQGVTTARVRVVDLSDRFVRLAAPITEVRVKGGHDARISLRYVVDCAGYERAKQTPQGATTPSLAMVVRERGPVGGWRQFTWPHGEAVSLGRACGEAPELDRP